MDSVVVCGPSVEDLEAQLDSKNILLWVQPSAEAQEAMKKKGYTLLSLYRLVGGKKPESLYVVVVVLMMRIETLRPSISLRTGMRLVLPSLVVTTTPRPPINSLMLETRLLGYSIVCLLINTK